VTIAAGILLAFALLRPREPRPKPELTDERSVRVAMEEVAA